MKYSAIFVLFNYILLTTVLLDATGHFTYWSQRTFARNVNKGLRLDYFVCSNRMTTPSGSHPHIFDCYTLPSDTIGASDHCPVMLILKQ